MSDTPLVNRVAQSGLITIDLSDYLSRAIEELDIAPFLDQGMILREKEFRAAVDAIDWQEYEGKDIAVHCSTDAIIPMWAYMLISVKAKPMVNRIGFGNKEDVVKKLLHDTIIELDLTDWEGKKLIIKGCGDPLVDESAYLTITERLAPIAESIMYGEPCSTVPIFKRKK